MELFPYCGWRQVEERSLLKAAHWLCRRSEILVQGLPRFIVLPQLWLWMLHVREQAVKAVSFFLVVLVRFQRYTVGCCWVAILLAKWNFQLIQQGGLVFRTGGGGGVSVGTENLDSHRFLLSPHSFQLFVSSCGDMHPRWDGPGASRFWVIWAAIGAYAFLIHFSRSSTVLLALVCMHRMLGEYSKWAGRSRVRCWVGCYLLVLGRGPRHQKEEEKTAGMKGKKEGERRGQTQTGGKAKIHFIYL